MINPGDFVEFYTDANGYAIPTVDAYKANMTCTGRVLLTQPDSYGSSYLLLEGTLAQSVSVCFTLTQTFIDKWAISNYPCVADLHSYLNKKVTWLYPGYHNNCPTISTVINKSTGFKVPEKQCKVCFKMNDMNVKSCWWCGDKI